MNKLIYSIGAILLLLASCTDDFTSNFEESSTERYLQQKGEFSKKLKDAEFGWVLQHFPSNDQQYGGYNFYFNFKDDLHTDVSYEFLDVDQVKVESTYSLKQSSGVVLSLDTYNGVAHFFATPSSDMYQGLGGEFEFNLLNNNPATDTIEVIGKKTRNKMRFIKLKESWKSYNDKVVENRTLLTDGSFYGVINGTQEIDVVSPSQRRMNFSFNENGEVKSISQAYIFTDKGIFFYEPVEINGVKYQDFTLNKETKELISADGSFKIKLLVTPVNFDQGWVLDVSEQANRSDKVYKAYKAVYDTNLATYTEELSTRMLLGTYRDEKGIHFNSVSSAGTYRSAHLLSFSGSKLGDNYLTISRNGTGTNWRFYGHLDSFVELLVSNAPYIVEKDNQNDPTQIKLTSSVDSDVWFVLTKRVE